MSSEEKLNHLKDWLAIMVNRKVNSLIDEYKAKDIYRETGLTMYFNRGGFFSFQFYLEMVKNNNK